MKYDLNQLKKRVSAQMVAVDMLGARVDGDRCAAVWRGGKNQNVQFYPDGTWHDFKTNQGGTCLDLLMIGDGLSLEAAAETIGDRYCPDAKREPRVAPSPPRSRRRHRTASGRAVAGTVPPTVASTMVMAPPAPPPCAPPVPAPPMAPPPVSATQAPASVIVPLPVLPSSPANRYETLLAEGYAVTAEYHYRTLEGLVSYTVVRLEKPDQGKELLQRSAAGWGMRNVTPVPYNLPEIVSATRVYIVEGEKDADNMMHRGFTPTTTNSGGAGKWQESFRRYFVGKEVVILADNDDKGMSHANKIATNLHPVAAWVKIVVPCPDIPKGDVTDFFNRQGTNEALHKLIDETPCFVPLRPGTITPDMLAEAKELNQVAFKNFTQVPTDNPDAPRIVPRNLNDMREEFFRRFLGFPFLLGQRTLFDHDKDTRTIYEISNRDQLYEWMQRKSGRNCEWRLGPGFIIKAEFYESIVAAAHRFESVSDTPDYPSNPETYYTYDELPPPSPGHEVFNRFCDFFCVAQDWHRPLLRTLFAAPLWYRPGCSRPSWVIDSVNGREVGKTTLAETVAKLYGGPPAKILREDIMRRPEEVIKRLISPTGRRLKVVIADNIVGEFHSEAMADWITSAHLTGRAPYSTGEDSRPNNLTWIITSNGAQLDSDLASRSFFLHLRRPDRAFGGWEAEVNSYIQRNRFVIFADMIDILTSHRHFQIPLSTRHSDFEREVLQAMCGTPECYQDVITHLNDSKEQANVDFDNCCQLIDGLRSFLADIRGVRPVSDCVWIQSDLLKVWTDKLFGRRMSCKVALDYAREGMTTLLDPDVTGRFPRSSGSNLRRSGIMWVGEHAERDRVKIVGLDKGLAILKGEAKYAK